MPNQKVLIEKQAIVEELTEKLRGVTGILVDYSGITVKEDTEMRAKLRTENVDYSVVKNTLMRLAIKNVGLEELDPLLNGTTSLAVSADDAVAPAKIIKEYATKFVNHFEIKGGFYDGKVISLDEINSLASIPALPVLQAQLLGTMLAPIVQFALVIKAIAEKDGAVVESTADATAEETPAAEAVAEVTEEAPAEETVAEATTTEEPAAEEAAAEAAPAAE